ncbi:MAG: hypothetical protein D6729_05880, partial [Deltaproteobacteria bacterium]
TLVAPANKAVFRTLDSPPEIEFRWSRLPIADRYRIVIAADPDLSEIAYTGLTRDPRLVHNALRTGTYYWTVHTVDAAGLESPPAPPWRLTVAQDRKPPRLVIRAPEEGAVVQADRVVVEGVTEAGAKVKVNGKPVTLGEGGTFGAEVKLAPGLNQIVVEAVDAANNVTFKNVRVRKE